MPRKQISFEQLDEIARDLPGVTTASKWGHFTWTVGDRGFAWRRPFSKADLKRFGDEVPPQGDILAIRVANLDAKEALLAIGLPGFFTIPHFNGYAGVLIALREARAKDVRAAFLDAFHAMAAMPPKKPKAPKTARASRSRRAKRAA